MRRESLFLGNVARFQRTYNGVGSQWIHFPTRGLGLGASAYTNPAKKVVHSMGKAFFFLWQGRSTYISFWSLSLLQLLLLCTSSNQLTLSMLYI